MGARKDSLDIKTSVDLVNLLPDADKKAIKVYEVKSKPVQCKLSIQSTQVHVRAAEIEAVGQKQLDGGVAILKGYVTPALVKIKAATSDKDRQALVKALAAQIEKINKGTAAAFQAAIEAHWKKIEKVESDGEKAVALAAELAKKEAKKQPKLSTLEWFKLILKVLATKTAVVKGFSEFQNARKSALLGLTAFAVESLRVEAEAKKGTAPATIAKQREILIKGHVKQMSEHLAALATCCTTLLDKVESVLAIVKKVDENAAKAHLEVRSLQFELEKLGELAEKVKPLLKALDASRASKLLQVLEAMASGKLAPSAKVASELGAQLDIDGDFSQLVDRMTLAGKHAAAVAKL